MILNSTHRNMLISSTRNIEGRVELYEGSTLLNTFKHTDALKSININRAGDNTKFFGFGVCQEIEVKLIDKDRAIEAKEKQSLKVSFITNNSTVSPTPRFYISDVRRDENTNELTVRGYDVIFQAKNYTVAELGLEAPYTISDVASKIAQFLGVSYNLNVVNRDAFNTEYPEGANFDGAETLREVLDAIAEATQTIYYVNNTNILTFRHLDITGDPILTIRKDDYITLKSKTNRRLSKIVSATELGDNVNASLAVSGTTQYVRDNPFWELRDDIATLLDNAIAVVGGLTLNQFDCEWRGNYLVEPGDKIALITKDDNTVISYMLNEKYEYIGSLSAETAWSYGGDDSETADNPSTLGEVLKQTYARVDKANKQIELVVSETDALEKQVSSISMTTNGITSTVSRMEGEIGSLTKTAITPEDLQLAINSVNQVTTTTGFTFNEAGLHVSKSDSEITTTITEDGMTVYRKNEAVLTADNLGVRAEDLHATTFLIVGNNSRFEDFEDTRTGCFYIGGSVEVWH